LARLKFWVLMVCLLVVLMLVGSDMFCLVFRSLVVDVFEGVEECERYVKEAGSGA